MWGSEFKVVDVAYGIQKLIVPLVIEDEKIGLEDLEEKILNLEGEQVQSVDLLNMVRACARARVRRRCPLPRPPRSQRVPHRHPRRCYPRCRLPPVQNKVSGR